MKKVKTLMTIKLLKKIFSKMNYRQLVKKITASKGIKILIKL